MASRLHLGAAFLLGAFTVARVLIVGVLVLGGCTVGSAVLAGGVSALLFAWDDWFPPFPSSAPMSTIMREVVADFTARCRAGEYGYVLPGMSPHDCLFFHSQLARCSMWFTSDEISPCRAEILRRFRAEAARWP